MSNKHRCLRKQQALQLIGELDQADVPALYRQGMHDAIVFLTQDAASNIEGYAEACHQHEDVARCFLREHAAEDDTEHSPMRGFSVRLVPERW